MKKVISLLISTVLICTLYFSTTEMSVAQAAIGSEGYAVYRDGVEIVGDKITNWHTGIMYDRTRTYSSLPVVQASGSGNYVNFVRWDHASYVSFLDGKNYKGTYIPKGGISSAGRDQVKSTAARLASDQIAYSILGQMSINQNIFGTKTYVTPSDITHMRCDGVVEYCYEFNGYRVYGNDSYWNIARATINHLNHHSKIAEINPKVQVESYMTKVSSVLP